MTLLAPFGEGWPKRAAVPELRCGEAHQCCEQAQAEAQATLALAAKCRMLAAACRGRPRPHEADRAGGPVGESAGLTAPHEGFFYYDCVYHVDLLLRMRRSTSRSSSSTAPADVELPRLDARPRQRFEPDHQSAANPQEPGAPSRGAPPLREEVPHDWAGACAATWTRHGDGLKPSQSGYRLQRPQSHEDKITRDVQQLLNKVSHKNLTRVVERFNDIVIHGSEDLQLVVSLIIRKVLDEPHYCETYARLVDSLRSRYPEFPPEGTGTKPLTFRRVLINAVQMEFEEILNEDEVALDAGERRRKASNNAKFIGHLFLRNLLAESVIHGVLSDLLDPGRHPLEECALRLRPGVGQEPLVECALQLLQVVGCKLEDTASGRPLIAQLSDRLDDLARRESPLSNRVRFKIKDVLDLQRRGWQEKVVRDQAKPSQEVRKDAAAEAKGKGKSSVDAKGKFRQHDLVDTPGLASSGTEEEAERKAEAERRAKEETERKAEAERKAKEEAERKADAERKAEADRKADAERKAEAERKDVLRALAEQRARAAERLRRLDRAGSLAEQRPRAEEARAERLEPSALRARRGEGGRAEGGEGGRVELDADPGGAGEQPLHVRVRCVLGRWAATADARRLARDWSACLTAGGAAELDIVDLLLEVGHGAHGEPAAEGSCARALSKLAERGGLSWAWEPLGSALLLLVQRLLLQEAPGPGERAERFLQVLLARLLLCDDGRGVGPHVLEPVVRDASAAQGQGADPTAGLPAVWSWLLGAVKFVCAWCGPLTTKWVLARRELSQALRDTGPRGTHSTQTSRRELAEILVSEGVIPPTPRHKCASRA